MLELYLSRGKAHPGEQSAGCFLGATQTTGTDQRYYLGVVKIDKSKQRKCSSTQPSSNHAIPCVYMNTWTPPSSLNRESFPSNPTEGSKNSARSSNQHTELIKHFKKIKLHSLSLTNIKYFKMSTQTIITLKSYDEGL